ncbi:MAG: hypothetical protein ABR607_01340 [Pyrinomonadaceae bacterium]
MRMEVSASFYMPPEHSIPEEKSRATLIIVVAAIAAVVIGGFFYLLLRKSVAPGAPPRLQGAIRPGSPDWDKYIKLIVLDEPADCPEPGAPFCATESKRALGDIVMTLRATVRNFTGRTIIGLEVRGTIVDHQNQPVRQRTIVGIPTAERPELSPNKTTSVSVVIDGFSDSDDRANTKMEVTGFILR